MTLFKQIMVAIMSFGLVIFIAVGILNFTTINNYISSQLSANARHTANSLGLAIKTAADLNDVSTIEAMVNSMFDSGYYSMIKLVDVDGRIVVENSQETMVEGVPDWFLKNIKLSAPIESSEIMDGWSKFGTLYIQSNTGIAYYELYTILKNVFYILTIISLIALSISYFGLKFIFIPLKKVQIQAEAILGNRFIIQDKIPFTVDIRRMVLAMNSMVSKVKDIFEQSAKTLSKYEDLLYKDDQTGLFNRRYFQNQFVDYLSSEEYSSGSVMMISCKELDNLKKGIGFEKWQSLVISIANVIRNNTQNMLCSRLNENDFIVVAPSIPPSRLLSTGENILFYIQDIFEKYCLDIDICFVNSAIVDYSHDAKLKNIMIIADMTILRAKESGNFKIKVYNEGSEILLGKEQYRELILSSIENNMFRFAGQRVVSNDKEIEHCELFLRLVDKNGIWQMASYFMPMVNELNFAAKIDLYVLNKVVSMLKDKTLPQGAISINLGKEVLTSTYYFSEIEAAFRQIKHNASNKIYIEIPNKDDLDIPILINLHQKLRDFGIGLGFDHFGFDTKSIDRLREISPDYVKITARDLIDFFGESSSEQKHSFDAMMRSKGITIVAISVENKLQMDKLQSLGISSMQGMFIEETKNIG
ncbi:bifunctional diguanylate cyclase/phosphodiesterase [Campylobacter sp. RM16192]|uniref:bifunctional diguanylate cyclase/phosphodiesterase n=1 Tax=Campylobacter sp. RM16192 TaxID=1660080 RepID=UPI001451939F|nr:LapD/MoxY N-terminal periplasmic domain-containing protein [Campylobacter sp. RM16192]QCD53107.1 diguanylate cyclase/phosphodiesterase [Campylobacter sp. RM16192]